jgi:hypothetical protein
MKLFYLDPKLEVSAAKPRDDLVQIKQLYLLSRGLNSQTGMYHPLHHRLQKSGDQW